MLIDSFQAISIRFLLNLKTSNNMACDDDYSIADAEIIGFISAEKMRAHDDQILFGTCC